MKVIFLDHDGVICLSNNWGGRIKKWSKYRSENPDSSKEKKDAPVFVRFDDFEEIKTYSGFKYIVEIEEYKYDFFIISFYPKLQPGFHSRQSKLASMGLEYRDKYSYRIS